MEKRTLLAALLAGAFLLLWYTVFAPPTPPPRPTRQPAVTPRAQASPTSPAGASGVKTTAKERAASPTAAGPPRPVERGKTAEKVTLEAEGWRAVVDSQGGLIASLVLRRYSDLAGHPLELVGETKPLTMEASGPWNEEPYAVERQGAALIMRWSDGRGDWVEKHFQPAVGAYGLSVRVEAGGAPARGGVVISGSLPEEKGGGTSLRFSHSGGLVGLGGKLHRFTPAKVNGREEVPGSVDFAGAEDQYFLLVLLPEAGVDRVALEGEKGKGFRVVAEAPSGVVRGTLFAGPKDRDVLAGFGRGLEETQSFGLFGILSVVFLGVLRWIHGYVGNWGVAIVVLTAAIRVLLFPLTHKSTVAMRRMQKLKPKMEAIQTRYKEKAKKDPQVRQRMNQEMMNLYKQEGVNPMGGCLPTLVQLPILWALYELFAVAIELRHAPFVAWVTDLSVPDTLFSISGFPIRPLAILMGASMFVQQKVAPQAGDPAQRRMFMMMPIIFTFMFYGFASGLVLYWLTNNVLTIAQQLITDRLLRADAARA
jgi:YidC/Oxa1 family membrane protein insertase